MFAWISKPEITKSEFATLNRSTVFIPFNGLFLKLDSSNSTVRLEYSRVPNISENQINV